MWYVQVSHTFFSGKQGDEEDSEDGGDHGRRTANGGTTSCRFLLPRKENLSVTSLNGGIKEEDRFT